MRIPKTWKRTGALLALAAVIGCLLIPIASWADSWYGQFMRDPNYYLDVNCKVGCSQAAPSPFPSSNPGYVRLQDVTTTVAARVDAGMQTGSIDNRNFLATESELFAQSGPSSVVAVNAAAGTHDLAVTTGGNVLVTLTATTCTQIGSAHILYRVWAGGTETATLTLYTDSGCTAILWTGVPPASQPIDLEANTANGIWYKFGAAPAVKDYATTD